jgi:predicted phosphodiesterase
MSVRSRVPAVLALALALLAFTRVSAMLPDVPGVTRFGIIGDSGTGEKPEYEVAWRLAEYRARAPFDFVVMLGDNMYGSERPQDFDLKFTEPFKPLLDAGVKFYATLGNHDDPDQRFFKPFNMNGERYYTFTKGPIEFFVIDSNYMDPKQRTWLERQLADSRAPWKIVYGHHPLYSTGSTHGSETDLRALIEPLFVKYGVNIVLAGHEHFYERLKPQKGIAYFISGGAAKLRDGDIQHVELEAAGFDTDRSFMVAQVAGDTFRFEAISRTGQVVDSGTVMNTAARQSDAR